MAKTNVIIKSLAICCCIILSGCGEEHVDQSTATSPQPQPEERSDNNAVSPAIHLSEALVGINEGKLEIHASLDGVENNRTKMIRFAKIAESQPITILQSSVYIQTAINNQAKLSAQLQLVYKPHGDVDDATDITIVSDEITDQGSGFHWHAKITGCKNSDCSETEETLIPTKGQIPESENMNTREVHELSIIWDEDKFQFLFSLDDIETRIDMQPYVAKSQFDPRNFSYAALTAEVSNVESESESGRIVVRFGDVFVNGHLYDDFNSDSINPDKWITGQIK